MRLKQALLEEQIREGRTLMSSVPTARATQDLDLFLNMEMWIEKEKGKAVRALLDGLDYQVIQGSENWQFGKLPDPATDRLQLKIDLHARQPRSDEPVKHDGRRVGQGIGLHGRETPEAFAMDDRPTLIQVSGLRTDGEQVQAAVLVPHPYASLNMKVKAAHDWLHVARGEAEQRAQSPKHVLDVYLLIAMMLPTEFEECHALVAQYADHPMAQENRGNATELFADPNGRGPVEVQRQIGDLPYDHDTFWDALQVVFGAE